VNFWSTGSPAWVIFYLASTVGMTAWMRRAEFRQGGRAAAVAWLDVLGNVSLVIPALAYWDADIAARIADPALWTLLGCGLLALFGFTGYDTRKILRNPGLMPRQRRIFAAISAAALLLPAAPEVWWGGSALAHVYAEALPKTGV
jgi:hypothetical protein